MGIGKVAAAAARLKPAQAQLIYAHIRRLSPSQASPPPLRLTRLAAAEVRALVREVVEAEVSGLRPHAQLPPLRPLQLDRLVLIYIYDDNHNNHDHHDDDHPNQDHREGARLVTVVVVMVVVVVVAM